MSKHGLRHELKHIINQSDYLSLLPRLKAVAKLDPHAAETGSYHIRSLYFDNTGDKALLEKINGVTDREKFRIRFYNFDNTLIKLEKKSKIHGLCRKTAATLSKEQCEKIIAGQLDWMMTSEDQLIKELYAKMLHHQLLPRTLVDYIREPYYYEPGGVRITIDRNIRTGVYSTAFFDKCTPTLSVPGNEMLLEIKYDAFLPDVIRDIIQTGRAQAAAYSKYAAGRMYG